MEKLQEWLDEQLKNKKNIIVLEAGCGSQSNLRYPKDSYIVGIDISEEQLLRNKDIHEAILGDIQDYQLPYEKFDLIVCWAVLEHLANPEKALLNFIKALKKGGLIVLAIPNVLSIKGLFTKYTPFFIHKMYYKKIMGRDIVGKEGKGPFKTYLRFSLAPERLKKFFANFGLDIKYYYAADVSQQEYWRQKSKVARFFIRNYSTVNKVVKSISFGFLGDSDFVMVVQKNAI